MRNHPVLGILLFAAIALLLPWWGIAVLGLLTPFLIVGFVPLLGVIWLGQTVRRVLRV